MKRQWLDAWGCINKLYEWLLVWNNALAPRMGKLNSIENCKCIEKFQRNRNSKKMCPEKAKELYRGYNILSIVIFETVRQPSLCF